MLFVEEVYPFCPSSFRAEEILVSTLVVGFFSASCKLGLPAGFSSLLCSLIDS